MNALRSVQLKYDAKNSSTLRNATCMFVHVLRAASRLVIGIRTSNAMIVQSMCSIAFGADHKYTTYVYRYC